MTEEKRIELEQILNILVENGECFQMTETEIKQLLFAEYDLNEDDAEYVISSIVSMPSYEKVAEDDEEKEERITSAENDVKTYLNEIGQIPMLTAQEEVELFEKYKNGNAKEKAEAKDKICLANLRLVFHTAKKYVRSGVSLMDLVQEGTVGLMHAVEKFNPGRGNKFSTYATWWIKKGMTAYIADDTIIHIPSSRQTELSQLNKKEQELTQLLKRAPTDVELCQALNISETELKKIRSFKFSTLSLDMKVGEEEGELQDFIPQNESNAEDEILAKERREILGKRLDQLDEEERSVIELSYGFVDGRTHNIPEIAKMLGKEPKSVRKIHIKALRKLKKTNS